MLSSLGVGAATTYYGPQIAPTGTGTSFLSIGYYKRPDFPSNLAALLSSVGMACYPCSNGIPLAAQRSIPQPFAVKEAALHDFGIASSGLSFDVRHISEGKFTEETINNMHKMVLNAKTDAEWRELMENIRREGRKAGAIGWKDYAGEVTWFDRWYREIHPVDYVRDPYQVELVMHPKHVYRKQLGDCDDLSALFAASLGALGAPHRFVTYKADPARPDEWSHVSTEIYVPGMGWVNEDLTIRGASPGFKPMGFETRIWPEPRW